MEDLNTLLAQAKAHIAEGRDAAAVPLMEAAFGAATMAQQRAGIAGWLGGYHYRSSDFAAAARWFRQATDAAPDEPALYYDLGQALAGTGDWPAAATAYLAGLGKGSRNAEHYLAAGFALDMAGRPEDAVSVWSLGDSLDPMLRKAQHHPEADPLTKAKSAAADTALRAHFSALHREGVDEQAVPRIHNAIWVQTHDREVAFADPLHQPQFFYIPELAPIPVYRADALAWADDLGDKADAILSELTAFQATGATGEPYVHAAAGLGPGWDALKGQDSWTSVHLYKGAERQAAADAFPETLRALNTVPVVRVDGAPLEVFFSILTPGTAIPPHFGLANSRLTVHLPLVIPSDCGLRVGNEAYDWTPGEVLAFDDSFEHEAWNRSDAVRMVLIFEIWHPELSTAECEAIEASFARRLDWLKARTVPAA